MGKRLKCFNHPYFILIGIIIFSLIAGIYGKSFGFEQNLSGEIPVAIQNGAVSEGLSDCASQSVLLAQKKLVYGNATVEVIVTAYSSSPDETDSTPYVTAAGTNVRSGIAAANFLPIGTLFSLPEIFGDEIFIVEDRLSDRFNDRVDIWMNSKDEARNFGQKIGRIEIL